eukprot:761392-Hanusia_phi.AAC.1
MHTWASSLACLTRPVALALALCRPCLSSLTSPSCRFRVSFPPAFSMNACLCYPSVSPAFPFLFIGRTHSEAVQAHVMSSQADKHASSVPLRPSISSSL